MEWCGLDSSGSGCGEMAGYFEKNNEPLRFIKCGEFSDQQRNS
jgi:hypothetical protein